MGSKTKKQKQLEEDIKKKIVRNHRLGKCDKEGRPVLELTKNEPTTGYNRTFSENFERIDWGTR